MNNETEYRPDRNARPIIGPTRLEIAALARRIYEREGCPEGRADAHWLEAERRLHIRCDYEDYDDEFGQTLSIA